MEYIKVRGAKESSAMQKLRDEYGNEAIIFSVRKVPVESFVGKTFGKKEWLIEAALKEKKSKSQSKNKIDALDAFLDKRAPKLSMPVKANAMLEDNTLLEKLNPPAVEKTISSKLKSSEGKKFLADLGLPNSEKPSRQTDSNESYERLESKMELILKSLASKSVKPGGNFIEKEFEELYSVLKEQYFSERWIMEFIETLKSQVPSSQWKHKKRLYVKAKELLATRILVKPILGSKRIIMLIGPTGVGKTTTLAKLAARLKLKEKKSVSMINLDNYRIAATEQLRQYSSILDMTYKVCKTPTEFQLALEEEVADMVLVDSTGFSQNNHEFITSFSEFFKGIEHTIEKHLVISATSKCEDAKQIADRFDALNFDRIILTKLDETSSIGNFLELSMIWNTPLSFVTDGQEVPRNLSEADKKDLAERVLHKWDD